ncbi:uncharacterized protein LOC142325850 [Lycorma delicatula]|uniref:uncharacterized protein LOC142325850 n=1 Tax=Lycorma delicatula TaxID=130591 RepID=UPI003F5175C0
MIAKVVILLSVAFISTEGAGLGSYASSSITPYSGHGIPALSSSSISGYHGAIATPAISSYSAPAISTPEISGYHTPVITAPVISTYHAPAIPASSISTYGPAIPAYHGTPAISSYAAPIPSFTAPYGHYPTSYGVPYGHSSFGGGYGFGY